jgi:hypothetical protein
VNAHPESAPTAASEPAPGPAPVYYAPHPADPRSKSPALASFLSLFPGLGQIYVGYYPHGFVNALVIACLITALATEDLDELAPLAASTPGAARRTTTRRSRASARSSYRASSGSQAFEGRSSAGSS